VTVVTTRPRYPMGSPHLLVTPMVGANRGRANVDVGA
jgi:hypothetical protein